MKTWKVSDSSSGPEWPAATNAACSLIPILKAIDTSCFDMLILAQFLELRVQRESR